MGSGSLENQYLKDVEGLSFRSDGSLFASLGSLGAPFPNSLWKISLIDGEARLWAQPGLSGDFEGCACGGRSAQQLSLSGFIDKNGNGKKESHEPGFPNLAVEIGFRDDEGTFPWA